MVISASFAAVFGKAGARATARIASMKLVILDRDGVINHDSDQYIKSPEEWKPIPGSLAAIARLNQAGYRVVVATNQSGVGRGLFETDTLIAIHDKMHKALAQVGGRIDAIFFCPHTNADNCDCRKPKPACCAKSPRASTPTCPAYRPSATRCATCRPPPSPARSRCWC
jgi:histidinol-phosphate phosphatase family protein